MLLIVYYAIVRDQHESNTHDFIHTPKILF